MTINEIKQLLDAEVICGENLDREVLSACGSDMMSDVLAYVKNHIEFYKIICYNHTNRNIKHFTE